MLFLSSSDSLTSGLVDMEFTNDHIMIICEGEQLGSGFDRERIEGERKDGGVCMESSGGLLPFKNSLGEKERETREERSNGAGTPPVDVFVAYIQ